MAIIRKIWNSFSGIFGRKESVDVPPAFEMGCRWSGPMHHPVTLLRKGRGIGPRPIRRTRQMPLPAIWLLDAGVECQVQDLAAKNHVSEPRALLDAVRGQPLAVDLTERERQVLAIAKDMDKQAIAKSIDDLRRAGVLR